MTGTSGMQPTNTTATLEAARDTLYETLAAIQAERKKFAGDPVRFNELSNEFDAINDQIIELIKAGLKKRTSEYVAVGKSLEDVNKELNERKKELEKLAANLQLVADTLKVVTGAIATLAKFVA